jgi:flagellar biogenesis protein FliO
MKIQNLGSSIYQQNSARAFAVSPRRSALRPFQNSEGLLSRAWSWIRTRQAARTSARRLQVATTVSLGEKRFLAVIHVDGAEFLIGGGATNVALLAQLNQKESFGGLLNETMKSPKKQPAKRLKKQNVIMVAKPEKEQQPAKRSRKLNIKPTARRTKEAA